LPDEREEGEEKEEENACDMRGMLSFMILWLLSKRPMYGQELAAEIGKRRGERPNPGTIYPALKDLAGRGMIRAHPEGHNNVYELTERGEAGLLKALAYFRRAFGEIFDSALAVKEERSPSGI
jgi:PadR family transcriptional regulator PadR